MCKYKEDKDGAPYPRVRYKTECGFDVVILAGYKSNEFGRRTDSLSLPTGSCMKCGDEITAVDERV